MGLRIEDHRINSFAYLQLLSAVLKQDTACSLSQTGHICLGGGASVPLLPASYIIHIDNSLIGSSSL